MARIAYILLCHKDPEAIVSQAKRLTAAGDFMAIHFDGRAKPEAYAQIRDALEDNPNVALVKKRVKCGWGEWSLVQATLNAIQTALESFPRASHFYMLSGDCMPIKSAEYVHEMLDRDDVDYVESFDFFESEWIKAGIKEERLIYRHFVNERKYKRLFYSLLKAQRWLGLRRDIPKDLQIMIGSQWWCLRRRTVEAIMTFTQQRKDVMRFFKTTWIPDETFFQTLVPHLVKDNEIRRRTLTFLIFTDYGIPVTFYNDHYDLLLSQNFLFARKISPEANELKQRLGDLYSAQDVDFQVSNEGRRLFSFLASRGRVGQRFAPRFWERESRLPRGCELLIVAAKKWHVAKRLVEQIHKVNGVPVIEYLFDEEACALPDLGGIETKLKKRTRHRRALMRMLFDYYQTDRMVVCVDPTHLDMMQDFQSDRSGLRVLEIESDFTDEYLFGHAERVGLAGQNTKRETLQRLLPTIRADFALESDRIKEAGFDAYHQLRESADLEINIRELSGFLTVPEDQAREILSLEHLFND